MALDAAALALCAKELSAALADARIDKIFEPTRDEVVLNLRTRTDNPRLFLSARSGSARVCLTKESFENPLTPPSFCMLLPKHLNASISRADGCWRCARCRTSAFCFLTSSAPTKWATPW